MPQWQHIARIRHIEKSLNIPFDLDLIHACTSHLAKSRQWCTVVREKSIKKCGKSGDFAHEIVHLNQTPRFSAIKNLKFPDFTGQKYKFREKNAGVVNSAISTGKNRKFREKNANSAIFSRNSAGSDRGN